MSSALIAIGGILIVFFIYAYFSFRKFKNTPDVSESEHIKILDDVNFNHQVKNGVAIVDFWASWCMPCKVMAPVLNEIAEEMNGKLNVCKVDVEKHQQLAVKYAVRNIPTLIMFKNGKEINRYVGVKQKDFLLKQINQAIA